MRLLCVALIACTFQNCNKEKNTFTAYVYTNRLDQYSHLKLFLNDKDKGDLPYFTKKMSFDDDSLLAKALVIKLPPDNYPFIVKDQWGNVKVDGHVKVKRGTLKTEAVIGELISTTRGKDVIIEIKYN